MHKSKLVDQELKRLEIVVDTRERIPYSFESFSEDHDFKLYRGKLDSGDYSLGPFMEHCAVERKELNDFIGCCSGGNRRRFKDELERLAEMPCSAVVIEGSFADIAAGRYVSRIHPSAVFGSIASWSTYYRIPFHLAGNRKGGEFLTFTLLRQYQRHLDALNLSAGGGLNHTRFELETDPISRIIRENYLYSEEHGEQIAVSLVK